MNSNKALTELNKKIQDYNPAEKLKLQSFWENPNKKSLLENKEYNIVYHGTSNLNAIKSMKTQASEDLQVGGLGKLSVEESEKRSSDSDSEALIYVGMNRQSVLERTGYSNIVMLAMKGDSQTDTERRTDFIPKTTDAVVISIDTVTNSSEMRRGILDDKEASNWNLLLGQRGIYPKVFFETCRQEARSIINSTILAENEVNALKVKELPTSEGIALINLTSMEVDSEILAYYKHLEKENLKIQDYLY